MDPITIMSVLVLAGFIGAGADLATGGLVRAELGGGVRGAGSYVRTAGSQRVRDARTAARQERMKTPLGRAVQFVLDEVGALGRGLFGGWRSGRRSARTAWEARRGDEPLPFVRICRGAAESARTWLDRHPNGNPNSAGQDPNETRTDTPNGEPERAPNDPNGQTPNGEPEPEREPERDVAPGPFGPNEEDPNREDDMKATCPCGYFHGRDEYGRSLHCGRPAAAPTPEQIPAQPTRTEGNTVTDINSAPAAIALFEAFRGRFEEPESLLTALRDEIAAAADSMGDFAIGGEGDLSAGLQSAVEGVVQAREALDAYLSALHLEYDASIEAAAGKNADAHSIMQEV